MPRLLVRLLLALIPLPVGAMPIQSPPGDGARAAAGRWTVRGGNLARTGVARTRPLRDQPVTAWSVDLEGTLEDEPLVWDQRVLVVERLEDEARLRGFDLTTGREIVQPYVVRCEDSLEASLWSTRIVVRSGDDRLSVLTWERGAQRMKVLRSSGHDHEVIGGLLFEDELYVATTGSVERRRAGGARVYWETPLKVVGAASLRGASLFVPVLESGVLTVTELDRETGEVRSIAPLGAMSAGSRVELTVLPTGVLVHGGPFLLATGLGTTSAMVPLPFPHRDVQVILPGGSLHGQAPAEVGQGWINHLLDDGQSGPQLIWNEDSKTPSVRILAGGVNHVDLLEHPVSPTVSGDVVYLAGCAIDLTSQRILWRRTPGRTRCVPARGTLLVVEREDRLVALRPETARRGSAVVQGADQDFEGRALFGDGFVIEGELRIVPAAEELIVLGRKVQRHPLANLLWVETEEGQLRYLASPEDLERGVELWIEHDLAGIYTDLARQARKSRDPRLLARLVRRALECGADAQRLEKAIEDLEDLRTRSLTIRDRVVGEVRNAELAALERPLERLWERYRRLPEECDPRLGFELLRAILQRDPAHGPASAAVRKGIPADFEAPAGALSVDWIDLIQAASECPVQLVPMPAEGEASNAVEEALARAGEQWRPDLVGLQSDHLLIVTPLAQPGAVARCLSVGELVCSALGEIFDGGQARAGGEELVLYLFESKAEYLRHSPGGESGSGLAWTAGHYDPTDNVSRIYLPPKEIAREEFDGTPVEGVESAAIDSVIQTYAHELTHHWLQMQCPLYTYAEARQRSDDGPGYWIVEGFASLVEEFDFDPARRRWESFRPTARRLDLVANAKPEQLLPWDSLYGASKLDFLRADLSDVRLIPSSWQVGTVRPFSGRNVYYAQAAATCHYLFHAEGGAFRARLLEYVRAHYTGQRKGLTIPEAFGLEAEELGRRAQAWAREPSR